MVGWNENSVVEGIDGMIWHFRGLDEDKLVPCSVMR